MPETGEATQVLKLGILDQSGRPGQPAAGGGTVGQVLLIVHREPECARRGSVGSDACWNNVYVRS
jgi:hypothetical protein